MNLSKFFNKKNIKKYQSLIVQIHQLEDVVYKNLPENKIAEKLLEIRNTTSLKHREKILHAMALSRKAALHVLGMAYYDVQLMGALALVDGCVTEMKTGEGKTLTCSAAVAANYALGYSTHVATANEYLATRDEEILRPLFTFLGIKSKCCVSQMERPEKQEAYKCDVVYSTAQELGFDLLRDNLVQHLDEKMQPLDFSKVKAIIDEADFILIDEARTPLIISGQTHGHDDTIYHVIKNISENLTKMAKAPSESALDADEHIPGDFWVDEKYKTVHLSEEGYGTLEKFVLDSGLIDQNTIKKTEHFSALYHENNVWIIHEVSNALKAKYCYINNKEYIVQNNEIVIIDQNTGRLSEGRSWSNGLHQAIEAKENVVINPENSSLGTISVQNFFRGYGSISGMSGTVMNSSEEFEQIYGVQTIQIPTNKRMIRKDHQDKVYLSMNAKYLGIIEDIEERHGKGQPILIGTTSVAESEIISELLNSKKIKHHVLNAKNNFKEAQIIAQAGQPYAVTVSTSMAGRGTDIILGGNKEALTNILKEQLNAITERRGFFAALQDQIQQQLGEQYQFEEFTPGHNEHFDHVDFNEIQDQINYLYHPPYITQLLNEGIAFVMRHIHILEQSILKQVQEVEQSGKQWREHVLSVGGLFVLGSSRNESRRIDDQLRGRSGRQGDPGESGFYLSIEDPWVNVFGKNPLFQHLARTLPPNEAISSPMVTRAFAKAQGNIESFHFNSRKDTFQYDSIADEGRRQFFKTRDSLLMNNESIKVVLKNSFIEIFTPLIHHEFVDFMEEKLKFTIDNPNELLKNILTFPFEEIEMYLNNFLTERPYLDMRDIKPSDLVMLEEKIDELISNNDEILFNALNNVTITQLDSLWRMHLIFIEEARQNVGFSSLAQKNPLQEYRKICFDGFSSMIHDLKHHTAKMFFHFMHEIEEMEKIKESSEILINSNIEEEINS